MKNNNSNNNSFTPTEECYFKYISEFSMEELIPYLEDKISSIMKKEYKIDYFITNVDSSKYLEVRYLAFPKQDNYIKALFSYKKHLYMYISNNIDCDKIVFEDFNKNNFDFKRYLDIQENNDTFLIAKEVITIEKAFDYLISSPKNYYLCDDFFCYPETLDPISDTIIDFAKKKIPVK